MSAFVEKLQFLFPVSGMKDTVRRFPLSAACSAVLFILIVGIIHDAIDDDHEVVLRLMALSVAGFFWFGSAKLIAESRALEKGQQIGLALAGFGALAALIFFSGDIWMRNLFFLIPGLLLLIMVAPYTKDGDDLSFWFFNRMTWFGVAVAIVAALVLGGGISAALASIHYLFDVDIDDEVYGDLWTFSCTVFGPLYALSWVPKQFTFRAEDCHDPPGLAFILNWVLAPLVLIYLLILYAYLIKIVVSWEIPRGQLSYMITGFGATGVVTYLMGWPLREEGAPLLRFFYRWFFPALIIPTGMMFVSIFERIGQYAVTEQRYAIVMTALWFALVAVAFTVRKLPLKVIPGVLAVLVLLASFGPWSAVSVSGASQFTRLKGLLNTYNILQGDKVVKTDQDIPFEDRKSISSILDYLYRTDRESWVEPWLEAPEDPDQYVGVYQVVEQMGFEYVSQWETRQQGDQFNIYSHMNDKPIDVRGYDFAFMSIYAHCGTDKGWEKTWQAGEGAFSPAVKWVIRDGVMTVSISDFDPVSFDLRDVVREDVLEQDQNIEHYIYRDTENEDMRVRIRIQSMNGEMKDDVPVINYLTFDTFIGLK